jgi:hypothetical protein
MICKTFSLECSAKLISALLLCVACVGLIGGCSCGPELDTSLLTGSPCRAPCWHNIIPGTSSEEVVHEQLESSSLVRKGTVRCDSAEQEGVLLTMCAWRDQKGDFNRLYLHDGKVLRIEIELDYDLTLGEVVDEYGPPEYVYAEAGGSFEYAVFLLYPTQGLGFTSYVFAPDAAKYIVSRDIGIVSKELKVEEAIYFSPTSLRELFEEVLLLSPSRVEHHVINSREWSDFGQVELAQ